MASYTRTSTNSTCYATLSVSISPSLTKRGTMTKLTNRPYQSYLPRDITDQSNETYGEFTFPDPYIQPQLKIVNPINPQFVKADTPFTCSGPDILKLEHIGNPFFIFGQPFSGKTCLFFKLLTRAGELYGPDHWIRYVEMKSMALMSRKLEKKPKDFLELLAIQLNVSFSELKQVFTPLPDAQSLISKRKYENLITGELFLDGFDEIPTPDREYFLRLIPQIRNNRAACPIRIWISSRSYQKTLWFKAGGEAATAAFEILPYSYRQQLDIIYFRWKHEFDSLTKAQEEKLWEFTQTAHNLLSHEIPDFETTIGSVPLFISIIAGVMFNFAASVVESIGTLPTNPGPGMCIGEILDALVINVIEFYLKLKLDNKPSDQGFILREYQRIARLYCKFAIQSFPFFECEHSFVGSKTKASAAAPAKPQSVSKFTIAPKPGSSSTKRTDGTVINAFNQQQQTNEISVPEELYRVGFLIKAQDGKSVFVNKILGDFFIGKYFAYPNSLDVRDLTFDSFFLRVFLFDAEAQPARRFFDAFLYFVREYQPRILHDFIIKHYRLSKNKRNEWKRIRDDGNIWHLMIMEGHHRTAQIIIDAFCIVTETEEMRQFLRMRAPIRMYEGLLDNTKSLNSPDQPPYQLHVVSSLGVLALFGYSFIVGDTFKLFLTIFDKEEIRKQFNQQGQWNPCHYACLHSNAWVLLQVYGTEFHKRIGIKKNLYNPLGQLGLHLLLTYSWSHVMVIRDLFYPDLDQLAECDSLADATTSGTSTQSKGKGKGAKKGGRCGNAKSQASKDSSATLGSPSSSRTGTKSKEEIHAHFREIYIFRDMPKDLGSDEYNMLLPCHFACIEKLVVNGGENVNAGEKHQGMTPLHIAAQAGLLETVKFLLKLNADVHVTDKLGRTPLHYAGLHGHRQVFMILVKKGAKAIERDTGNLSPIMLWKEYGEPLFLEHGIEPPMTIAEMHFFNACYDIDKLLSAINSKHELLIAEDLKRKAAKLEEDFRKMEIKEDEGWLLNEKVFGQINGRHEVNIAGKENEEDPEEHSDHQSVMDDGNDTCCKSESSEEPSTVEVTPETSPKKDDANKCKSDEEQAKEDEEERDKTLQHRSKKIKVKIVKKNCEHGEGAFEEILIDRSTKTDDKEDSDSSIDESDIQGIQTSNGTLELEFVGDDGEPVVPTARVYNEVVGHLTKLLDFRRSMSK